MISIAAGIAVDGAIWRGHAGYLYNRIDGRAADDAQMRRFDDNR